MNAINDGVVVEPKEFLMITIFLSILSLLEIRSKSNVESSEFSK